MKEDAVSRLTERQRECLRLVYLHKETKEIAREVGISPDGVTQRIKGAMRTLGVDRRRDAAMLLAEAEGLTPYPPQVYPPRDIATPDEPVTFAPSAGGQWQRESSGERVMERQDLYVASFPTRPALPLPIGGTRPNDVGWAKRLTWIVGLVIGIALGFGALVAGVEALTRLFRS